jgi:hypothetical protein
MSKQAKTPFSPDKSGAGSAAPLLSHLIHYRARSGYKSRPLLSGETCRWRLYFVDNIY